MRFLVVTLLLLTACDRVFGLANITPPPPDGPAPDVVPVDALTCQNAAEHFETFDNSDPRFVCTWGYVEQRNCTVSIANGSMTMTPMPNLGGQCACGAFSTEELTRAGVFAQVSAIGNQSGEYLFFAADSGDPAGGQLAILRSGTNLVFNGLSGSGLGSVAYDPVSTPWWRIRPAQDLQSTFAEVSADGLTWTVFATDPVPSPTKIKVSFVFGAFGAGEPVTSSAVLDGLNVCP